MRLRNMTIYSHCSTMLMIARVLQMPKISWCFISSLFGSVLKEKKLFLQSFSALYSHFCWNHFSFGFLLRTSPYVTFVVFVVIFIYIIVKCSLYLGILLHLGFVLLRAYHTNKKNTTKKRGLWLLPLPLSLMLLMTLPSIYLQNERNASSSAKMLQKTPLDQRSERYIGNFQVERTKKTSKKYAQRVLNFNEWCSHNEITNDTSMHTDYMSFNRFKSNKHSVAELTTGAHAQLTHTTRFRTSESNCDRLYYFLSSRVFFLVHFFSLHSVLTLLHWFQK